MEYEPKFDYENNLKIRQSELKIKDNYVYENNDEIESVFNDYYTKDDKLNKIVKQKIKKKNSMANNCFQMKKNFHFKQ